MQHDYIFIDASQASTNDFSTNSTTIRELELAENKIITNPMKVHRTNVRGEFRLTFVNQRRPATVCMAWASLFWGTTYIQQQRRKFGMI